MNLLPYEVQFRYLLELPLRDILNYCQTSPAAWEICNSEVFWRTKSIKDYGLESHNALEYSNLSDLYAKSPSALIGMYMDKNDTTRLRDVVFRTDSKRFGKILERYLLTANNLDQARVFYDKFTSENYFPATTYVELYRKSEGPLKDAAQEWSRQ